MIDLYYPLLNIDITSMFGERPNQFGGNGITLHNGIDLRAQEGTDVMASADGLVIWTGYSGDYEHIDEQGRQHYSSGFGNAVILEHDEGFLTLYAHLQNSNVDYGQFVKQGEVIGHSGNTGGSTGPHLHFELIDGNQIRQNGQTIKDTIKYCGKHKSPSKYGTQAVGVGGSEGRIDPITGKTAKELKDAGRSCVPEVLDKTNICGFNPTRHTRETLPTKYYIWHTQGDDKVRSSHEELDGTIHSIDEDIFPGEDYNCRCWAEEVSDEEALR